MDLYPPSKTSLFFISYMVISLDFYDLLETLKLHSLILVDVIVEKSRSTTHTSETTLSYYLLFRLCVERRLIYLIRCNFNSWSDWFTFNFLSILLKLDYSHKSINWKRETIIFWSECFIVWTKYWNNCRLNNCYYFPVVSCFRWKRKKEVFG